MVILLSKYGNAFLYASTWYCRVIPAPRCNNIPVHAVQPMILLSLSVILLYIKYHVCHQCSEELELVNYEKWLKL